MAERWITYKGRHLLVDNDGSIVRNKQYIAKEYTRENINDYFNKIENADELLEWQEDYREKIGFMPLIVPKKNSINRQVGNIEKIDNNNIKFSILNYETGGYRIAKSSVNNFKKNYKAKME